MLDFLNQAQEEKKKNSFPKLMNSSEGQGWGLLGVTKNLPDWHVPGLFDTMATFYSGKSLELARGCPKFLE